MKKFLLSLSLIVTTAHSLFGALAPAPVAVPSVSVSAPAVFDTAHAADVVNTMPADNVHFMRTGNIVTIPSEAIQKFLMSYGVNIEFEKACIAELLEQLEWDDDADVDVAEAIHNVLEKIALTFDSLAASQNGWFGFAKKLYRHFTKSDFEKSIDLLVARTQKDKLMLSISVQNVGDVESFFIPVPSAPALYLAIGRLMRNIRTAIKSDDNAAAYFARVFDIGLRIDQIDAQPPEIIGIIQNLESVDCSMQHTALEQLKPLLNNTNINAFTTEKVLAAVMNLAIQNLKSTDRSKILLAQEAWDFCFKHNYTQAFSKVTSAFDRTWFEGSPVTDLMLLRMDTFIKLQTSLIEHNYTQDLFIASDIANGFDKKAKTKFGTDAANYLKPSVQKLQEALQNLRKTRMESVYESTIPTHLIASETTTPPPNGMTYFVTLHGDHNGAVLKKFTRIAEMPINDKIILIAPNSLLSSPETHKFISAISDDNNWTVYGNKKHTFFMCIPTHLVETYDFSMLGINPNEMRKIKSVEDFVAAIKTINENTTINPSDLAESLLPSPLKKRIFLDGHGRMHAKFLDLRSSEGSIAHLSKDKYQEFLQVLQDWGSVAFLSIFTCHASGINRSYFHSDTQGNPLTYPFSIVVWGLLEQVTHFIPMYERFITFSQSAEPEKSSIETLQAIDGMFSSTIIQEKENDGGVIGRSASRELVEETIQVAYVRPAHSKEFVLLPSHNDDLGHLLVKGKSAHRINEYSCSKDHEALDLKEAIVLLTGPYIPCHLKATTSLQSLVPGQAIHFIKNATIAISDQDQSIGSYLSNYDALNILLGKVITREIIDTSSPNKVAYKYFVEKGCHKAYFFEQLTIKHKHLSLALTPALLAVPAGTQKPFLIGRVRDSATGEYASSQWIMVSVEPFLDVGSTNYDYDPDDLQHAVSVSFLPPKDAIQRMLEIFNKTQPWPSAMHPDMVKTVNEKIQMSMSGVE